ncbi:MAG TPA: hypothetical protein VER55_08650 [Ardenticatenaceae bacterium]|nr:hypothetical protein [Ardenticatenaceae bacterium]
MMACRPARDGGEPPALDADFTARTDPGEDAPAAAVTVDFGDELRLLGFDAPTTPEGVALVTYWTALRPVERELVPWPYLSGTIGGNVLSSPPGAALPALAQQPARSWQPGHVVRLAMPPVAVEQEQEAEIVVAVLVDGDAAARLAPRLGAATVVVQPTSDGSAVVLGRVRGGRAELERRLFELPTVQQRANVTFGDVAVLRGYDVRADEDAILVTVYWEALQPSEQSLAVRVELLDSDGRSISHAESVPRVGRRPTSGWAPGEIIPDSYRLALPDVEEARTLTLALFDPSSGAPLPVQAEDGEPLPDDRLSLPLEALP